MFVVLSGVVVDVIGVCVVDVVLTGNEVIVMFFVVGMIGSSVAFDIVLNVVVAIVVASFSGKTSLFFGSSIRLLVL